MRSSHRLDDVVLQHIKNKALLNRLTHAIHMIGLGLVGLRRLLRRVGHPRPCCGVSGALYAGRVLHPRNLPSAPAGVGHDPAVVRTGGADWIGRWPGTTGSAALLRRARIWLSLPTSTSDDHAVGSAAVGGVSGTAGQLASVVDTVANGGNAGVGCGCHSGQL